MQRPNEKIMYPQINVKGKGELKISKNLQDGGVCVCVYLSTCLK